MISLLSVYCVGSVVADDYAVDMWSVGAILHLLLRGCPPLLGDSYVWSVNSSMSYDALNLLGKLLHPVPASRLSIEGALDHRWMRMKKEQLTLRPLLEALQGIRTRYCESQLLNNTADAMDADGMPRPPSRSLAGSSLPAGTGARKSRPNSLQRSLGTRKVDFSDEDLIEIDFSRNSTASTLTDNGDVNMFNRMFVSIFGRPKTIQK